MVFNSDGLFNRASKTAKIYNKAKAQETLNMVLSEAKMKKYAEGLTDAELDKMIYDVGGDLLPKENDTTTKQQVIIDGYIFEIDRNGPSIIGGVSSDEPTTVGEMSVEKAKNTITSMSALKKYMGTKVAYKPGETWQIFYYDDEGDFGSAGTLYLKRACGEVPYIALMQSDKTEMTDPAVAMMRQMNPEWAKSSYSVVNTESEKACVYLCDSTVWNKYKNNTYSSYAIGSPSVEMYMKAFNVWKTGDKNADNLIYKIGNEYGYSVGAHGDYTWNNSDPRHTGNNSIEAGPNNVFMTKGYNWWLASPSSDCSYNMVYVYDQFESLYYWTLAGGWRVCPIVPLDL